MNTDGPLLVRRGEAMRILGVGWRTFGRLLEARVVKPRKFGGAGKRWFVREELEAMVAGPPIRQAQGESVGRTLSFDTTRLPGGKRRA